MHDRKSTLGWNLGGGAEFEAGPALCQKGHTSHS